MLPSHIQEPLAGYCAVLLCVFVRVVDNLFDASLLGYFNMVVLPPYFSFVHLLYVR